MPRRTKQEIKHRLMMARAKRATVFDVEQFRGKSIAVVGNAKFSKDYSKVIDSFDVVIRFNNLNTYFSGKSGRKFTHWVNNQLVRKERAIRAAKRAGIKSAAVIGYRGLKLISSIAIMGSSLSLLDSLRIQYEQGVELV